MNTLKSTLERFSKIQPDKVALYDIDNDIQITWKELLEESLKLSKTENFTNYEDLHIIEKDNSIELVKEMLACYLAGKVFFSIGSPFLKDFQKSSQINFVKQNFVYKKGVFQIRVSSGSTDKAKFFYATEQHRLFSAEVVKQKLKITRKDSILPMGLPLSTGFGDNCIIRSLVAGCRLLLTNKYGVNDFLRQLETHKPTLVFSSSGGISQFYINKGKYIEDFNIKLSPRVWWSGAGPLTYEFAKKVENILEGKVIQTYLSTECSIPHLPNLTDPIETRIGTVGKLTEGILSEDGEILIHKDNISETVGGVTPFDGDYYHTGDLGKLDLTGNLIITGRKKLVINDGDNDLNPFEIEKALSAISTDIVCVGIKINRIYPDQESPCLVIKGPKLNIDEIKNILLKSLNVNLQHYYYIDEFPKLKNYKVDRVKLSKDSQNLYTNISETFDKYDVSLVTK